MAGVMSDLSFSARGPALCVPFGIGLLLASQPAKAAAVVGAASSAHTVQASVHSAASTPGKAEKGTWSSTACLAMMGEDPFGARDYALDWLRHDGGRPARHCHALALIELGDEQTAAQELDDLSRKEPFTGPDSSASVRAVMATEAAEAWLSANQPANALSIIAYGLSIRPGDETLILAKARALLAQNDMKTVVSELTALVARNPTVSPAAYVMLATAERRLGALDKARAHIEEALSRTPDDAAALLERGIIREQTGDATGARVDWQHVLDLAPDGHEADLARQDLAVLAADPDSP